MVYLRTKRRRTMKKCIFYGGVVSIFLMISSNSFAGFFEKELIFQLNNPTKVARKVGCNSFGVNELFRGVDVPPNQTVEKRVTITVVVVTPIVCHYTPGKAVLRYGGGGVNPIDREDYTITEEAGRSRGEAWIPNTDKAPVTVILKIYETGYADINSKASP
jgi:hypothetical protein